MSKLYRSILLVSVALLAIGLPWSNFLMSVSVIISGLCTLYRFFTKSFSFRTLLGFGSLLVLVYLMHVLWLINSEDLAYGINDLRKKLPLLVVPIVFMANKDILAPYYNRALQIFTAATLLCALVYLIRWYILNLEDNQFRNFSVLISHIRFSVCICLALLFLLQERIKNRLPIWLAVLGAVLGLWSVIIMQSVSAFAILLFVLPLFIYFNALVKVRTVVFIYFIGITMVSGLGAMHYLQKDPIPRSFPTHTEMGNAYQHIVENNMCENGHHIYRYLSIDEMNEAWKARTGISAKKPVVNGYDYQAILIRYLSSKNLTKDARGIEALTPKDVEHIKKGYTNYKWPEMSALRKRYEAIFFEIDSYLSSKNVVGHSLIMRLEYASVALSVFQNEPFFGTGTGDIRAEMLKEHEARGVLPEKFRKRAHNQWITFLSTFGLIGALILMYVLLIFWVGRHNLTPLGRSIALVLSLSFFWEDVLETQAGVSAFAFFFSLLFTIKAPKSKGAEQNVKYPQV